MKLTLMKVVQDVDNGVIFYSMASSSIKLEDCEVCLKNKAKYTCPKCEVRTCCLTCVNIHKTELECDGIRNKTKFVPLNSFTDLDLLNDYRLLEEVGRSVDKFKKCPIKKCTRESNLPVHLSKLKAAAYKRKTNLQLMPRNFSRHKNNTTFFNWKTNELFWRIEWIFPQAENTMWVMERALDTTRLASLLEEVLNPIDSVENKRDIEELNVKLNLSERLQFYQSAGLYGIKVLLKAENVTKSNTKFYELDITQTLQENLENKTVIEYPTIYVVLKDHVYMYELIDTDDENEGHTSNVYQKERLHKHKNKNKTKKNNESVNYFFDNDLSESEDEVTNHSNLNIPDYNELVKLEQ